MDVILCLVEHRPDRKTAELIRIVPPSFYRKFSVAYGMQDEAIGGR